MKQLFNIFVVTMIAQTFCAQSILEKSQTPPFFPEKKNIFISNRGPLNIPAHHQDLSDDAIEKIQVIVDEIKKTDNFKDFSEKLTGISEIKTNDEKIDTALTQIAESTNTLNQLTPSQLQTKSVDAFADYLNASHELQDKLKFLQNLNVTQKVKNVLGKLADQVDLAIGAKASEEIDAAASGIGGNYETQGSLLRAHALLHPLIEKPEVAEKLKDKEFGDKIEILATATNSALNEDSQKFFEDVKKAAERARKIKFEESEEVAIQGLVGDAAQTAANTASNEVSTNLQAGQTALTEAQNNAQQLHQNVTAGATAGKTLEKKSATPGKNQKQIVRKKKKQSTTCSAIETAPKKKRKKKSSCNTSNAVEKRASDKRVINKTKRAKRQYGS